MAGSPETETTPMTDAELRVVREHLGLTTRWLADHLSVAERSIHRWENGDRDVPDGVRVAVEDLERVTAELVTAAVGACSDARDPGMLTYRSDIDYRAAHPVQPWPASWHRALVARVAQEVPGLEINYWSADMTQNPDTKITIPSTTLFAVEETRNLLRVYLPGRESQVGEIRKNARAGGWVPSWGAAGDGSGPEADLRVGPPQKTRQAALAWIASFMSQT